MRRKEPVSEGTSEQQDDIALKEEEDNLNVSDIKLQQQMRVRKVGASASSLIKPESKQRRDPTGTSNATDSTLETVMGSQFSSQMDYGLQESVPHKKILDAFIDEKLGLNNDSTEMSKRKPAFAATSAAEDELYRVPDNIKAAPEPAAQSKVVTGDSESNGVTSAWSTCIAEVALPITFKLRNIEDTEQATRARNFPSSFGSSGNQRGGSSGAGGGAARSGSSSNPSATSVPNSTAAVSLAAAQPVTGRVPIGVHAAAVPVAQLPYSRFQVPDHARVRRHRDDYKQLENAKHLEQQQQQQHQRNPLKRSQQSNDDYVMQKFRRRQMAMRR